MDFKKSAGVLVTPALIGASSAIGTEVYRLSPFDNCSGPPSKHVIKVYVAMPYSQARSQQGWFHRSHVSVQWHPQAQQMNEPWPMADTSNECTIVLVGFKPRRRGYCLV